MFKKTDQEFIVLEPKDGFLKLAVFSVTTGRLYVRALEFIPILDQPIEVLGRELKETLKRKGITRQDTYLIAPRNSLIIRYLTIPSQQPHEIREMLQLGLHQYIPYEAHEVSFDFRVAEERDDGFSKVLLFSALESQVSELLTLAERAGLNVIDVFCSSETAWRAIAGHEGCQKATKQAWKNVVWVLIDADVLSTDVIGFGGEEIKFTRVITHGNRSGAGETHDPQAFEQWYTEIKLSLETFSKEFPSAVIEGILVNVTERAEENLVMALARDTNAKVIALDARQLPVVWNEGSAMLNAFRQKGISFLSLAGGALNMVQGGGLSLLPRVRRMEQARKQKEHEMIKAGIFFAGALACVAIFFLVNLGLVWAELGKIHQQVRALEREASVAEQALQKLEVISDVYSDKTLILDMIRELAERTPEGITTLRHLEFEEGNSVKIRGLSAKKHVVYDYATRLGESNIFRKVEVDFARSTRVEGQEFFDFQIVSLFARDTS